MDQLLARDATMYLQLFVFSRAGGPAFFCAVVPVIFHYTWCLHPSICSIYHHIVNNIQSLTHQKCMRNGRSPVLYFRGICASLPLAPAPAGAVLPTPPADGGRHPANAAAAAVPSAYIYLYLQLPIATHTRHARAYFKVFCSTGFQNIHSDTKLTVRFATGQQTSAKATSPRSESNGRRPGPGFGQESEKIGSLFRLPEQSCVPIINCTAGLL